MLLSVYFPTYFVRCELCIYWMMAINYKIKSIKANVIYVMLSEVIPLELLALMFN